MPGFTPGVVGVWTGRRGLDGYWRIPVPEYIQVSPKPAGDTLVEEAQPQPLSPSGLYWEGIQPMQPAARLTSVQSASSWQQGQVFSGVALGIFGSLLATWLLLGRPAEDASFAEVRAGLKAIQDELDLRAQLATMMAERDAAISAAETERKLAADRVEDLRRSYENRIAALSRMKQEEPPIPRRRGRPKEGRGLGADWD